MLSQLVPGGAQRFEQYDALLDARDALRVELAVSDRVTMPSEPCTPAVAERGRRPDPFDLGTIGSRQTATRVAQIAQLDLALQREVRNHQGATAATGCIAARWIPALVRRAEHSDEAAPGGAPFGSTWYELDSLTGKRSRHENHAAARLDYRVAASADRANLTFDCAGTRHQRSIGPTSSWRVDSPLMR